MVLCKCTFRGRKSNDDILVLFFFHLSSRSLNRPSIPTSIAAVAAFIVIGAGMIRWAFITKTGLSLNIDNGVDFKLIHSILRCVSDDLIAV